VGQEGITNFSKVDGLIEEIQKKTVGAQMEKGLCEYKRWGAREKAGKKRVSSFPLNILLHCLFLLQDFQLR